MALCPTGRSKKLLKLLRIYTRRWYLYTPALLLPYFLLYLLNYRLKNITSHPCNGSSLSVTAGTPFLPAALRGLNPPEWVTPEERALLVASVERWDFSAGLCHGCSAYRQKRLISPRASICSPTVDGKDPELLILVSTIHSHREHRDMIRQTWGSHTNHNTGRVRLLFLFGKDPGGDVRQQRLLQEEGAASGDVLQDDFKSMYRRGGEVQLIMGYTWAVEYCSNVTHVLKVSDDVFVNVPKVLELISTENLTNSIWGEPNFYKPPFRLKGHRWYTSYEEWPAALYPHYVAGAYMGSTLPVIRKILQIFPYTAWTAGADDVIVGLCAEKLGIPVRTVAGFFVWKEWEPWTEPCKVKGPKYAVHFHGHPPKTHREWWNRRNCFV